MRELHCVAGEARWPHDSHQTGVGRTDVEPRQAPGSHHGRQTGGDLGTISPSPCPGQISGVSTGHSGSIMITASIYFTIFRNI